MEEIKRVYVSLNTCAFEIDRVFLPSDFTFVVEPELVVPVCSPDHLNTVRKGHTSGSVGRCHCAHRAEVFDRELCS